MILPYYGAVNETIRSTDDLQITHPYRTYTTCFSTKHRPHPSSCHVLKYRYESYHVLNFADLTNKDPKR